MDAPSRRSLWQAWLAVSALEQGGALYERLGLRPLFRLVAGMYGESLPPAAGGALGDAFDADEARRVAWWSRYHEVVNVLAVAVQAPLAPLGAASGSALLAAYGGALCAMHAACVGLERYKRARCLDLLPDGPGAARPTARYAPAPAFLSRPPASYWFAPRRFETGAFFRRTGTERFRRVVLWVYAVAFAGTEGSRSGPDFLPRGAAGLAGLDGQSRVAEVSHLLGLLLHVPFLVAAVQRGMALGVAYVLFLLSLNVWCALIQRNHRARIVRALARREARA
ncbi:MAG: hypothetical protein NT029_09985 [Armatimonadetes bacterium]|nr:hypothetical protein [Armatimonadota bacterium]